MVRHKILYAVSGEGTHCSLCNAAKTSNTIRKETVTLVGPSATLLSPYLALPPPPLPPVLPDPHFTIHPNTPLCRYSRVVIASQRCATRRACPSESATTIAAYRCIPKTALCFAHFSSRVFLFLANKTRTIMKDINHKVVQEPELISAVHRDKTLQYFDQPHSKLNTTSIRVVCLVSRLLSSKTFFLMGSSSTNLPPQHFLLWHSRPTLLLSTTNLGRSDNAPSRPPSTTP